MPYNPEDPLVLVISNQEPIAYRQTHNHNEDILELQSLSFQIKERAPAA